MPDIIITPSTGKLEFIDNSAQVTRRHSFTLDQNDGLVLDAPLSAAAVIAPLNVINVTVNNSNVNYPLVLASGSAETGTKTLMMDGSGGTYNPFTNTATIDISGNSATTTLASNSTNLGGVAAASYVTLTGTQTLTNKTITGTFTGNLTGTGSWATNAVNANTATNSTQLNGQSDSYYTNIPARLGYTPVNKAGDTISGNLTVNGNFAVNGSVTAFSASNIYITSSNLTVTDNILLMNALSPYQRYAGIQMHDSGSGTLSQFLWDGEGDYFFLTGSSVNGKIITGPDGQTNLSSNYVPKATAGYKLGNSLIYDNGTNVGIGNTTPRALLDLARTNNVGQILLIGETSTNTRVGFGLDSSTAGMRIFTANIASETINLGGISTSDGTTWTRNHSFGIAGKNSWLNEQGGNVGIGTTNPTVKLHVNGGMTFGYGSDATFFTGTEFDSSKYLIIQNNTDAYGRIGLTLNAKTFSSANTASTNDGWSIDPRSGIRFRAWLSGDSDYATKFTIQHLLANATNAVGDLGIFARGYGTTVPAFILTGAGNVGIAKTSPNARFDVNGNTIISGSLITTSSISAYSTITATNTLYIQKNVGGYLSYITAEQTSASTGDAFKFWNSGGNTLLTVTYDGNLGIGTTSTAQKLDVVGNIRCVPVSSAWAEGLSFSMPTTSSWGGLRWRRERANADGNHYIGYVGTDTTDDLVFGSNNAGTQIDNNIRITKAGLVGVGTSSPVAKLHVVGVISGSSFSGAGTGLTGTAASLTAGTATNATQLGGVSAASYVTLNDTQSLTNKTITGTFTGALTGNASTATTSTQLGGYDSTRFLGSRSSNITAFDFNTLTGNDILSTGAASWTGTSNFPTNAVTGNSYQYGTIVNFASLAYSAGIVQTYWPDNDNTGFYFRQKWATNAWTGRVWQQVLTNANYNSFAPTLTGTGASGNWAITSSWATNAVTALNVGNGTITIAAGTGVGVGTTNTFTTNQSGATTVTISNSGVTSNVAGSGISVSGATGAVTITNSGVTAITTNTGLSTNASATGAVTITNTGVTSITTNTGLSTNASATGAVTITNTGVTSNVAGTGISLSGGTGAVTITNSSPNATHTGDVTGATTLTIANDAVTTAKILNANVTLAKIANITAGTILGNNNASAAAAPLALTAAQVATMLSGQTMNIVGTASSETLGTVTGRGASTSTQISVSTSAGGSMYTGIKSGTSYGDGISGATFKSITDNPNGGSYAFAAYYNGVPGTNSFFVAADGTGYFRGSVGIGTTSPSVPLDVSGSYIRSFSIAGNAEPGFVADYPSSNGYGGFFIHVNNTRRWRIGSVGDTNVQPALNFWQEGTGSRMIIGNTGNVGIGTTGPAYKLDVNGTFNATGTSTLAGVSITGTINSSATEAVRVNNNSGYISFYNTAGNSRTGYIQGLTGGSLTLSSENGAFLQFLVGGTERLRIDTSGNVGIGTTSVNAKVESYYSSNAITFNYLATNLNGNSPIPVYGFDVTSGAESRSIKAGIGYERHLTNGRGTLHFYNDSTNDTASLSGNRSSAGDIKMSLDNSGNLGIGTVVPSALLNIRASAPTGTGTVTTGTNLLIDSNTNNYITFRNTSDNGTYAGLVFLDNNIGGYIAYRSYTADGVVAGSDSMLYGTYQDHIFQNGYVNENLYNRTETMRIKQNGYVGINTNNPTARLQVVQGNSGGVAAILLSSDESTIQGPSANTQIRMGSNLVLNASGIIPISTNGSERVRIDSSGNVGIGTTSAGQKLDVEGRIRTRGATGTGGFEIGAASSGAAKWRIEWDSASDSLDFNWVG